ncbi:SDR family oxidoreductase [Hyphococcus flavus]|uniref:SDR family oxidoreductase n=1 Tax=Hyphococcus flavus TaxID=1866326 RepID=A0AAE9ZDR8_9PROT|nr:SDR family oxidoreductase [Hyphococcus flavus]WDI32686.1 SDR family oxidoreductase [Hyphococcus flavus]
MEYQGKWALITGASAGIGATFARIYAAKGANLILVARREDRLKELASEVKRAHGVEVKTIAADLADAAAPKIIAGALAQDDTPVDILVNNAGFGLPGFFTENDWTAHRDFLELMVNSYAHMTRAFLPGMIARDYGRVIQVSSVAGLVPGSAGHTLYGPSKAFLVSFAQSIDAECAGKNVNSTALCPGFTYSEFHDVNKTRGLVSQLPKYMFMKAEPVVEGAINAVERGHVVYVPGAWNKFTVWLAKALPRPWAAAMVRNQSKRFRRKKGDG